MERISEDTETVELGVASEVTEGGIVGTPEAGGRFRLTGIGDDD